MRSLDSLDKAKGVENWPARFAREGVHWLWVESHTEYFTSDSRAQRVEFRGTPLGSAWGEARLVLDRFMALPTAGIRIVSETGSDTGQGHLVTPHVLRTGFAEPIRMTPRSLASPAGSPWGVLPEQLNEVAAQLGNSGTALAHVPAVKSPFGREAIHGLMTIALRTRVMVTRIAIGPAPA